MKNKLYIVASGLAALLIAGAPVAFAHDKGQAGTSFNLGLHTGQIMHSDREDSERGHQDKENAKDNEQDNDKDDDNDARANRAEKSSHAAVGIVTSVNGSVFTINPFGPKATTTVTTDGTTVFKAKGGATTSAALAVGSRVIVVGTTTATSSTGDSITAYIVKIIGEGFGHMRFWFGFKH